MITCLMAVLALLVYLGIAIIYLRAPIGERVVDLPAHEIGEALADDPEQWADLEEDLDLFVVTEAEIAHIEDMGGE